jgi:large subunit ribosomal protein L21
VPIYAIVRAGGRQYRVEPSQTLDVDRIDAKVGSTVDLSVLLVGGNGDTQVGTPLVDGAHVVAEVVDHGRGKKLLVFKYKNKTRYRRRQGHRQDYTRLSIKEIVTKGGVASAVAKPKTRRKGLAEPELEQPEPEITAQVETAEAPEAAGTAVKAKPARAKAKTVAPKTAAPKAARLARAKKAAEAPEAAVTAVKAKPARAKAKTVAPKTAAPKAARPARAKKAAETAAAPEAAAPEAQQAQGE